VHDAESKRSPDERSDIRDSSDPAYRCAHAGYLLNRFAIEAYIPVCFLISSRDASDSRARPQRRERAADAQVGKRDHDRTLGGLGLDVARDSAGITEV